MSVSVKKKGTIVALLAVILIIVIVIGNSLAYFTDSEQVENVFTLGKVKIGLDEPGWQDTDGLGLLPGNVRTKDPTVTATEGKSYMRVRMDIVDGDGNLITDTDRINLILETLYYDTAYGSASPYIVGSQKYKTDDLQALVTQGRINKVYNSAAFAFAGIETGKPAVRYYNYIANGGIFDATGTPADVAVLFSNVVIPKDWNNKEIADLSGDTYTIDQNGAVEITAEGNGYRVILTAEAIQESDMDNAAEAFQALDEAAGITRDTSGI